MQLKYLSCLDGIRACALLLVFTAHMGLDKIVPGGLGVTIFFFLSGYLITSLLRGEWARTGDISLRKFYLRRVIRIFPTLYIILAIGFVLDYLSLPLHQATGLGLASVVFYFYNYAELLQLHGLGLPVGIKLVWSLMIEEHFYFVFPFVYLAMMRRRLGRRTMVTALSLACVAALIWRFVLVYKFHTGLEGDFLWTYDATDARFDSILWGSILAIGCNPWFGDRGGVLEKHEGKFALGGLAVMLATILIRNPEFRQTLRYTLQSMALIPIFYYIVSEPSRWQTRWLSWKPLRWVGWTSYAIYLCHVFIWQSLAIVWNPKGWKLALATAVIAGLFAEAIRRLVENPLRDLKKKKRLEVAVNN